MDHGNKDIHTTDEHEENDEVPPGLRRVAVAPAPGFNDASEVAARPADELNSEEATREVEVSKRLESLSFEGLPPKDRSITDVDRIRDGTALDLDFNFGILPGSHIVPAASGLKHSAEEVAPVKVML